MKILLKEETPNIVFTILKVLLESISLTIVREILKVDTFYLSLFLHGLKFMHMHSFIHAHTFKLKFLQDFLSISVTPASARQKP